MPQNRSGRPIKYEKGDPRKLAGSVANFSVVVGNFYKFWQLHEVVFDRLLNDSEYVESFKDYLTNIEGMKDADTKIKGMKKGEYGRNSTMIRYIIYLFFMSVATPEELGGIADG